MRPATEFWEKRPQSFVGKKGWVIAACVLVTVQFGLAFLCYLAGLITMAVTMVIAIIVCCSMFLWRVWKG